jgi:hypothetical protein
VLLHRVRHPNGRIVSHDTTIPQGALGTWAPPSARPDARRRHRLAGAAFRSETDGRR